MTPLVLSKRFVKQLGMVTANLPSTGHTSTGVHPMNWHSTSYDIPSTLLYALPSVAPQKLCLRSNFTLSVYSLAPQHSSHKQCSSEHSQYWLNTSDTEITVQYTDPRTNSEHTILWQPYTSFILSSEHPHSVLNHNDIEVNWLCVHTGMTWQDTAKHYQHQW
jgi:hypothetical protein